jgi:phage terminase small subunit
MILTLRQRRFVEEYCVDFNATQAAIRSGYSKRTARFIGAENLTKLNIQEAVAERTRALAERTEVSRDWIIRQAREIVEAARGAGSWAAATSSLTLLAKMQGYVLEKRDVRMTRRFEDLSDEELAELVAAAEAERTAHH